MELFDRLAQSKFRSGFYLKEKDKAYAADKGREKNRKACTGFHPYASGACSDPQ